jgi:hypothetical protein
MKTVRGANEDDAMFRPNIPFVTQTGKKRKMSILTNTSDGIFDEKKRIIITSTEDTFEYTFNMYKRAGKDPIEITK